MKVALFALFLLTAWLYWPTRSFAFVYEDIGIPADAPVSLAPRGLTAWTLTGQGPEAAHLTNLAVHLVNGLLLFGVLSQLRSLSPQLRIFLVGLWWLHPIQVESVAYVSGRADLLVVTCLLLMLLAADRAPALAFVAACGAIWAKETGVVAFSLWWLWKVRTDGWWASRGLLLLSAVPACWLAWRFLPHLNSWRPEPIAGPLQFVLWQAAAVWRLLALVVVPVGFTADHDIERVGPVLACGALAGLLLLAWAAWVQRSARPGLSFGIAWLLIALFPRFLVPLVNVISERQLHVALLGPVLGVALSFSKESYVPA